MLRNQTPTEAHNFNVSCHSLTLGSNVTSGLMFASTRGRSVVMMQALPSTSVAI